MSDRPAAALEGSTTHTALDVRNLGGSLPRKTLVGFITALLAVFLISFVSYRTLQDRERAARRLSDSITLTKQLEGILSTLKDAETGQRGYLLTGTDSYLEPYNAAVESLPGRLEQARRGLRDDVAQSTRLENVVQLTQGKVAELQQTIDLRRKGNFEAALGIVRMNQGRVLMDRLRAAIEEMIVAEQSQVEAHSRAWERTVALSTTATWSGSALLLFLIIASASMAARDFREQRIEAWLRTAQGDLAQHAQGEQAVAKLADKITAHLARTLGAQVGALHVAERDGTPRLLGAYGVANGNEGAKETGGKERPAVTDGLARQVFEDQRVLHVRDVPDDFFRVRSALGSGKARHLLVAPVTADGAVNGVVELGFFRAPVAHDLELLRRVAEPIGMAIRSATYRTELQHLLEETQRQAEELQTQQEELRVQNEELEQQSKALQRSKTQLENQQAELEQINAQLEEQTQSLARQRDELARAQTELQRANTYKSEFLANMSHELRTPLNSSLILAKLLMDNREGNLTSEQLKFAQTIYTAGNDLLTLINDILDLSKIEAGKLDVRAEDVPLTRIIDELKTTFQPVAKDRGLELSLATTATAPRSVYSDPTRLQQILKNLLSNALKFTQRGGVSLLVSRERDGRLAFAVQDTGIGIPAEQQDLIFEAFRQVDGTANRKYGGTGLGLSISRDLARLLGGELNVASTPGKGSTFTLVLPERYEGENTAAPAAPALAPRPKSPVAASRGAPSVVRAPREAREPRAMHSTVEDDRNVVTPGMRTILIVEDDASFARVLADLARELDFKVLAAPTAEAGLALAEQYRPSAIVLDVGLPDRSGLSVLDALKHNSTTRHIPVHIVSASDYTRTALEMGAAGYAIKPVKREELVDALERLEKKFTQKMRRVLIVEDDPVHRESTCKLVAGADVECVAVGTGGEALEELGKTTFDCMILDLSLPDRTGLELLEDMARGEQYGFPPVIVYTGRSLSRDEEQQLRRFSSSIVIKGARSPERLLDEVTLFLHQVEAELPADRQRMLRDARHRESIFDGRRVLVVEDDVRNIFALTSVLEPKGAKVEIARNGREALAHLKEKPGVDLVLMDIMMPEMDGLEATREIRKQPELAKLPIIALTAKAMADDRENCLAAGANDYIAKPLDVDKLLSLARVWMPR